MRIYDEYLSFFKNCSSSILDCDDKTIEWNIYERFDLGANSFISDTFMDTLIKKKYIDKKIYALTKRLGNEGIKLLDSDAQREADFIKSSLHWKAIFDLSDYILKLLENRNDDNPR